ncbi:putative ribonuclease ZC3H12C [Taenia solium]|eukprot:TsM_000144800 transcript=TsM_000144800 gene=TsM_000144800
MLELGSLELLCEVPRLFVFFVGSVCLGCWVRIACSGSNCSHWQRNKMYKTTVKIPTDFANVDELTMTEPGCTGEVVIRTNLASELEGAQNLSLLFIGPESTVKSELPVKILKLFSIPTIQRYLARSYKLIVTNINCTNLLFRGSEVAVSIITKALLKMQLSKPCSQSLADENLNRLCRLHDIDIKQIDDMSEGLHSVLYDFIVELESLMNSQNSAIQNSNGLDKLGFVEVFRQNKSLQNWAPETPVTRPVDIPAAAKSASRPRARNRAQSCDQLGTPLKALPFFPSAALETEVRRLRPIVIDGANVAHGESSNSTFNVSNLRCVINYFVQRGHEEIAVVLPSDGQTPCATVFSPTEIAKYFVFTPVRRLDRGVRPQRTDDDSVILQYAQEKEGVVISNDQYRDWLKARPEFRDLIENRVIPYSLRGGIFIISYYPLGKNKPYLDEILAFPR